MATKYWIGGATAVAQVSTGSIDSVDGTPADNTFTVTIGGVAVSAVGDTDVATTATALRSNLNSSTHPYFASITWSGSSGDITGTADTPGVPFVAALTETGAGSGTVTDFSTSTASAGPSDISTAGNWSDGAAPAGSDTLIIADSNDVICYGLDQNSIDLTALIVKKTFEGKIGLKYDEFAITAAGATGTIGSANTANYHEYRETYLKIGATRAEFGQHSGAGTPSGSGRIRFNNDKAGSATTVVYETASVPETSGRSAFQFLAGNSGVDLFVVKAPAGVGIAEEPTETATLGDINITAGDTSTITQISDGVTYTNLNIEGGTNYVDSASTVTAATITDGINYVDGSFTITALNVKGGNVYANGSVVATTANLSGGTTDTTGSNEARTWATVNLSSGATLIGNDDFLTITTLNEPDGPYTITVD